ncbi:MAG: septation protein IspZ [Alphaproteobacteria bacterium]|nr:septation protein IspZ [Alphaproteobacteria bacterium]
MTRTKALTEFGPLLLFFAANLLYGIMSATAVLVIATVAAVTYAMAKEGRVPWIPVVGAVLVSIFGGLTLIFDDAIFLKIKPTVASLLFASALLIGLALRRYFLKMALGSILELDDRGWRNLTLYWSAVFVVMAVVNEIAWRNLSTDGWVTFKTFGLTGLAIVASLGAAPIMKTIRRND